MKKDIVLLSTADWSNPFWTNKQHVAVELARLGHKVLYVDSLGLRAPSLNRSDIFRIFRRLLKGLRPPVKKRDNLWVWSPIVIPFQKYRFVRSLNKVLLSFFSHLFIFFLGLRKPLLWTYNPMTLDVFRINKDSIVVYHCVDDIKAQPGMPYKEIEAAEERLVRRADYVFVTSNKLYEKNCALTDHIHMFSNVADYNHFSRALSNDVEQPDDMGGGEGPVIGFIGAISGYKQDLKLVEFIAANKPEWQIVLIGKVGEGDPGTNVNNLKNFDNVLFLGSRPYSQLPSYIKSFDVAIIPAALNEYTHAMFPMKFFEYLAAGKRVVSTAIDSLKDYADYCEIADNNDDFIMKIENVLNSEDVDLEKRLALAKQNTYASRTQKMLAIINQAESAC